MAEIKFTTNLPLSSDINCPKFWVFDPKYFDSIPDKPGVYIVGVKLGMNDPSQIFDEIGKPVLHKEKIEKFCPLYVGIHQHLRTRIKGHQTPNSPNGELNTNKELFDLKRQPSVFYKDIEFFDHNFIMSGRTRSPLVKNFVFNSIRATPYNNSLIWFPDFNFFDIYLGATVSDWDNSHNCGHRRSLNIKNTGELDAMVMSGIAGAVNLRDNIQKVKDLIESNFCYACVTAEDIANLIKEDYKHPLLDDAMKYDGNNYMLGKKNGPGRNLCESVENATKKALAGIGIYTYAKAHKPKHHFDIDLTDIKDDLVNMTGKAFPLTSGKFIV